MSTQLVKLSEENINLVKSTEGIDNDLLIKQFYMQSGDNIFIKKAGLLYKMEQKFDGNYSIETELASEDDYNRMRKMMNLQENTPCVVMKSTVTTSKGKYTAFGTATYQNCFNKNYLLEIAETRAELRAIRKATNCGFTSAEEVDGNQAAPQQTNGNGQSLSEIISQSKLSPEKVLEIASKELGKPVTTLKGLEKTDLVKITTAIKKHIEENTVEGTVL